MTAISYHAPVSREEVAGLLAAHPGARVLSGGTDLIVQMRSGRAAPAAVVDVKRVPGMAGMMGMHQQMERRMAMMEQMMQMMVDRDSAMPRK